MAEYWKSTPKYWCKYCKVFVRDTPFERKQHEATGRHQGGIQKSLRDLHRGKEQEQREKDRAKSEVARLTGLVSSGGNTKNSGVGAVEAPTRAPERNVATAEDRKRQAAQLAAMGIAVPQEYRADAAMKGEWETIAVHAIGGASAAAKQEEDEDEKKPDSIIKGVRKRKIDNADDEEIDGRSRPRWGKDVKAYRGRDEEVDLDALLHETITLKQDEVKKEQSPARSDREPEIEQAAIPKEAEAVDNVPDELKSENAAIEETPLPAVVFKKRKAKTIRER